MNIRRFWLAHRQPRHFICYLAFLAVFNSLMAFLSREGGNVRPLVHNGNLAATLFYLVINAFSHILRYPASNPAYRRWLLQTPWTSGNPLPLGPAHVTYYDAGIIAVLTIFCAIVHPTLPWSVPPLVFLAAYNLGALILLSLVHRTKEATAIYFGFLALAFAVPQWDVALGIMICIYGFAAHGLRMGLRQLSLIDERPFLRRKDGREELPWTFTRLGPQTIIEAFPLPLPVALFISITATLWLAAAYRGMESTGNSPESDWRPLAFVYVLAVAVLTLNRLSKYISNTKPALSLKARIHTGQLWLAGYDIIFLAPVAVIVFNAAVFYLYLKFDLQLLPTAQVLLFVTSFIHLYAGPSLKKFYATAPVGLTPKRVSIDDGETVSELELARRAAQNATISDLARIDMRDPRIGSGGLINPLVEFWRWMAPVLPRGYWLLWVAWAYFPVPWLFQLFVEDEDIEQGFSFAVRSIVLSLAALIMGVMRNRTNMLLDNRKLVQWLHNMGWNPQAPFVLGQTGWKLQDLVVLLVLGGIGVAHAYSFWNEAIKNETGWLLIICCSLSAVYLLGYALQKLFSTEKQDAIAMWRLTLIAICAGLPVLWGHWFLLGLALCLMVAVALRIDGRLYQLAIKNKNMEINEIDETIEMLNKTAFRNNERSYHSLAPVREKRKRWQESCLRAVMLGWIGFCVVELTQALAEEKRLAPVAYILLYYFISLSWTGLRCRDYYLGRRAPLSFFARLIKFRPFIRRYDYVWCYHLLLAFLLFLLPILLFILGARGGALCGLSTAIALVALYGPWPDMQKWNLTGNFSYSGLISKTGDC